ncbi:MAG TPA: hypothetical protein VFA79_16780 [Myxococcales bacterium]|nr:hypothetical protein [Myxococcales bacterium]
MQTALHRFHVPVMGTGFTIDSALRVAKLGISTVISLVDDHLIERVRRHYAAVHGFPEEPIGSREPDSRARRITAYLDLIDTVVARQMAEIRALPLEPGNDKWRYLSLLDDASPLKDLFRVARIAEGREREELDAAISAQMRPGGVGVNIMTKLDRAREGGASMSDAKAALRGFARSRLSGSLVLSAGINPALFSCLEEHPCFFRDAEGGLQKTVVLKVSDLRSALIQGKFLAKKGIEIAEFRIESGLNCGGHVFATDGELLGPILEEFKHERSRFPALFEPLLEKARGPLHPSARGRRIPVTVQGGVGTHGEMRRLLEGYGMDAVGWATPFLLVPEVVLMDDETRAQLAASTERELYVSDASPLGVPFNNLRDSSSERWTRERVEAGTPGSPCPNGFVALSTDASGKQICAASAEYQGAKIKELGYATPPSWEEADETVRAIYAKACICHHLGNGTLRALGISRSELPVAVCPGPNLAYFDRTCELEEMVDHIYGRGASLTPPDRPHLFAKELGLYVEHLEKLAAAAKDAKAQRAVEAFAANLLLGLDHYAKLGAEIPYPGENLESLREALGPQRARITALAGAKRAALPA